MFIVAFADEGVGHSPFHQMRQLDGSRVGHVLAMEIQNSSLTVLHCSYVMKRKPRLHDGIVTIHLDKNKLVELPRSSRSHQTMDSQGFC